ncbi:MAG: biotin/lipoyl-containing protein [Bacteroidota bacterium]
MANQYKLRVNEEFEYSLTEEDLESLDVVPTGKDAYHVLQDGQSFNLYFSENDFDGRAYTIKVNNTPYKISIANPLDVLISEMGFELNAASQVGSIEAPMPGLILEVSVTEGQEVHEGDPLLILEAMKMENVITSPRDGIIKSIPVKQGEAVEKKHLLITFE